MAKARRRYIMRQEAKTFLESYPSHDSFERLMANQLLTNMLAEDRLKTLKETFLQAAKNRNDEAAEKLVKLIGKAYSQKEKKIAEGPDGDHHLGKATNRAKRQLYDYLIDVYWQLPDAKVSREFNCSTMLRTKFCILEHIIQDWQTESSFGTLRDIEKSIKAFRFLIAAFRPLSKKRYPHEGESESEIKARGRWVSQEEKDKILGLIRKYDIGFKPEKLAEWLKQPYLPTEFKKALAIARTRNGGPKLTQKDIRNTELLEPFSPEERSSAAIDLYIQFGQKVVILDLKVQKLLEQMKSGDWLNREEIGASECVEDKILFSYPDFNLSSIKITVSLKSDRSRELGRDICGRARRHIEKWKSALEENIKVVLDVLGGKENLKMTLEL